MLFAFVPVRGSLLIWSICWHQGELDSMLGALVQTRNPKLTPEKLKPLMAMSLSGENKALVQGAVALQ